MPYYYEIRVDGHLDPCWVDWFEGMQLTRLEGNETLIAGPVRDQAALHGLLELIRDLNLTLISVMRGPTSSQSSQTEPKGGSNEDSTGRV